MIPRHLNRFTTGIGKSAIPLATGTCWSRKVPKDLVQELFVDLWDKRGQINVMETMEGYLKTAIRNRVYNHIRSLGIKKRHYDTIRQDVKESGFPTEELEQ